MDFTSLGVPEPLAAALAARGITEPTEIQREVIPAACAGESLIGEAPTGTGKTLAYLLPALMRIDPAVRAAQVLVLAPTHELAMQIAGAARLCGRDGHASPCRRDDGAPQLYADGR